MWTATLLTTASAIPIAQMKWRQQLPSQNRSIDYLLELSFPTNILQIMCIEALPTSDPQIRSPQCWARYSTPGSVLLRDASLPKACMLGAVCISRPCQGSGIFVLLKPRLVMADEASHSVSFCQLPLLDIYQRRLVKNKQILRQLH